MAMSFLVQQIKFGGDCFYKRFRFIHLAQSLRNKRIQLHNDLSTSKTIYRHDLSLSDNIIKKYLKYLTKVYAEKRKYDDNISLVMKARKVVDLLENRLRIEEDMKSLEELGDQDEEMKKLGHDEYIACQNHLIELDGELLNVILDNTGKDDCRDIIFEITAGIGGQEAMLFTADLLSMYRKHFEYLGFTHDLIDLNAESGIGGVKHASILVSGMRAYELLRHEGGIHRVQRVPATDKSGRMHTSTASVVILPQPTDIEVNLYDRDLKVETKRSSSAGGQSVNTTDSAVRITHFPTGIVVEAQSERSQVQNKKVALIKLKAKIYDMQINEQKSGQGLLRKKQRGMSQRNEKIRTYNYSQDRVTDHRLTNGTLRNLKGFMEGGESLEDFQERLQRDFQLKLLREIIEKHK